MYSMTKLMFEGEEGMSECFEFELPIGKMDDLGDESRLVVDVDHVATLCYLILFIRNQLNMHGGGEEGETISNE